MLVPCHRLCHELGEAAQAHAAGQAAVEAIGRHLRKIQAHCGMDDTPIQNAALAKAFNNATGWMQVCSLHVDGSV